jgi:hypothetical protein
MQEAGVVGCRASSIAPVRRCERPSETEMESHWVRRAKARRSSCLMAQSLRSGVSPAAECVQTERPSRRAGLVSPEVSSRHRRACADCFPEPTPSLRLWAASPGATPARRCQHTMRVLSQPSKPELSTWLGVGTFYFGPTVNRDRCTTAHGLKMERAAHNLCGRGVGCGTARSRTEEPFAWFGMSFRQIAYRASG